MEALKMPLRQILRTYTKSELFMIAWRSSESAFNMAQIHARNFNSVAAGVQRPEIPVEHEAELEDKLGPAIVDKFGGVYGEVDLRKLTGDEAVRYMKALGETGGAN